MTAQLQLFMILGAVVLLLIIFAFLKRGLMSVKYSLLWLALAVGLVIAAAFPYVVYVLRDLLDIEMPVNLVFLLMFCFVLVVLLSLSIAISQLADKGVKFQAISTSTWSSVANRASIRSNCLLLSRSSRR